jgi:hypothetical protein
MRSSLACAVSLSQHEQAAKIAHFFTRLFSSSSVHSRCEIESSPDPGSSFTFDWISLSASGESMVR